MAQIEVDDIDPQALAAAARVLGTTTPAETVDAALRRVVDPGQTARPGSVAEVEVFADAAAAERLRR